MRNADKQKLVRDCVVYQNTQSIQNHIDRDDTLKVEYECLDKDLEQIIQAIDRNPCSLNSRYIIEFLRSLSEVGDFDQQINNVEYIILRQRKMPIICLENNNDSVVAGKTASIKMLVVKLAVQRMRAKLYLEDKGVFSADAVAAKLDAIGLDKIERLMEGDKIISNEKNYFLEYFNNFTAIIPAWKRATDHEINSPKRNEDVVNMFWNQFSQSQIRRVMVIRKQNSGLCYLHAPVVYEHYLIAIATDCSNCGIINIGKYVASVMSGDNLTNFLFQDKGGNSVETLDTICSLTEDDKEIVRIPDKGKYPLFYKEVCEEILLNISLKPALVSSFKVYSDFLNSKNVRFSGKPKTSDPKCPERHSMVLIGARKSTAGEYFFLLQNWWEGRYFIEVSGEYMSHCDAMITFVKKAIIRKLELSTFICDALYAETSADAAETCYEK